VSAPAVVGDHAIAENDTLVGLEFDLEGHVLILAEADTCGLAGGE
jgi:hypothetical protein